MHAQADELKLLREQLHATQEAFKREEHHAQLLEAELLRLRCSQSACLSIRTDSDTSALDLLQQQQSLGSLPGQQHQQQDAVSVGTAEDASMSDVQLKRR